MKTNIPKTKKEVEAKILEIVSRGYICCGDMTGKCKCQENSDKIKTREIMALLNPVEKEKEIPFCVRCGHDRIKGFYEAGCNFYGKYFKRHKWNQKVGNVTPPQAPSPNEAPKVEEYKGHATLKNPCYCECHTEGDEEECPKCKFAKAPKEEADVNLGFQGLLMRRQPPPPDKEWEGKFYDLFDYEDGDWVAGENVLNYIRQLLKAKDQEADRRVREAMIKRIRAKKVDARPEITEWLTHKNRKQAEAYNGLLEEIAQEIEFELEIERLNKLSPQKGRKGGK